MDPSTSFPLPEYVSVIPTASYDSSGKLSSVSPVQRFSEEQKPVYPFLQLMCSAFRDAYILGDEIDHRTVNGWFNEINNYSEMIRQAHNVTQVDFISLLLSTGIGMFTFPAADRAKIVKLPIPNLAIFVDAGYKIAKYINDNISFNLRFELYKEHLQSIAQELIVQELAGRNPEDQEPLDLQIFLERISDSMLGFEKCTVPLVFLRTMHKTHKRQLAARNTFTAIVPNPTESQQRVFTLVAEEGTILLKVNAMFPQMKTLPPDPYGYQNELQRLPMNRNLLSVHLTDYKNVGMGPLNNVTKQWIMLKAAVRFLYENPRSTIEDAVDASVNIVQGSICDVYHTSPLGDPEDIERCKQAVIPELTLLRVRELCHIGRWKDHLVFVEYLLSGDPSNWEAYYYPDIKYMGHQNPPLTKEDAKDHPTLELDNVRYPVVMRRYVKMNNHGAGDCGIYASGMQSRFDLVRWFSTHPEWLPFLPGYLKKGKLHDFLSMQGHLNGIGTVIQGDGYLIRYGQEALETARSEILVEARKQWKHSKGEFLKLSKDEQEKVKKTNPGAAPWDPKKALESYGRALPEAKDIGLDFGFISSLQSRPIHMWVEKTQLDVEKLTDQFSPSNLSSWIIPDRFMPKSDRSRPIVIYAIPGHFMSLIDENDVIAKARNIRHIEARGPEFAKLMLMES
jgi:hypothetical protein